MLQEQTHVGVDKVERYNWTVSDKPGTFQLISKDRLEINREDYQREPKETKVLEIARNWSWVACGCILVANRGGQYFIIDGQYRTMAARKRSDIKVLPCLIFQVTEVKEEAEGFLRSNTNRKPITSRDRFRALVTTGDENAIFIDALLRDSNRGADAGIAAAQCLTALLKAAEKDRVALISIWPIADKLCGGRSVHTNILRALIWMEARMAASGQSLTERKWKDRLLTAGFDDLLDATRKAEGFRGRGGEKTWAEGILQRINKGLQQKLVLE